MKWVRITIGQSILNTIYLLCIEQKYSLGSCVRRKTVSKIYIFLAFNLLWVSSTTKP